MTIAVSAFELLCIASIVGMVYCLLNLVWINHVAGRFQSDISKPWSEDLDAGRTDSATFYMAEGRRSILEYERNSPLYWIRHWNEPFGRAKLEAQNHECKR